MHTYRTHTCSEINKKDSGKKEEKVVDAEFEEVNKKDSKKSA